MNGYMALYLRKKIFFMIKEVISDYREFRAWFFNWLFCFRQSLKMSLAIKLADIKQKAFNKQFHIMLLELPKGEKLVSVCRADIERFKRKKWLPKNIRTFDLIHGESVFYSTPVNRNNKSTPADRLAAKEKYFRYRKILVV